MSNPVFRSSLASTQLGALVADYPGSAARFIWIVLWAAVSVFGALASLSQGSFGGLLFWFASGAGCYAYYYYRQRDVHAEIFEHGFAISRGGKTISARWEDIAKVEHWVKQTYLYGVVPAGGKSHTYTIILTDGERVKVSAAFKNAAQLGNAIQRMWAQAAVAQVNRSSS